MGDTVQPTGATSIYRYYEDHGNWKHVYHGLIFVDDKLKFFGLNGSPDFVKNLEVLE